jgi:hypothetical protein
MAHASYSIANSGLPSQTLIQPLCNHAAARIERKSPIDIGGTAVDVADNKGEGNAGSIEGHRVVPAQLSHAPNKPCGFRDHMPGRSPNCVIGWRADRRDQTVHQADQVNIDVHLRSLAVAIEPAATRSPG